MSAQPVEGARASGANSEFIVVARGLLRPQSLRQDGDVIEVRTPISGDPQRAGLLHVATIACLKAPGAVVIDDVLGRRHTPEDWPAPSPNGGMPVSILLKFAYAQDRWTTSGLERLGLGELALVGPDEPRVERGIQQATAAWIVANDPGARTLSVGDAQLKLTGDPVLEVNDAGGQPWSPPALAPTEPAKRVAPVKLRPPSAKPKRTRPSRPKPLSRPKPKAPEEKPTPEPKPKPKPAFLPEYR